MRFNGKDISEKKLTSYNDVFAEIFNSLIFHGTGLLIDPDDLEAMIMFLKEITGDMNLFREGLQKYEEAEREGRRVTMIDLYGGAYRGGFDAGLSEGISKGLAEGISKGLAEGIAKGAEYTSRVYNSGLALLKKLGASPEDLAEFEASYHDTGINQWQHAQD